MDERAQEKSLEADAEADGELSAHLRRVAIGMVDGVQRTHVASAHLVADVAWTKLGSVQADPAWATELTMRHTREGAVALGRQDSDAGQADVDVAADEFVGLTGELSGAGNACVVVAGRNADPKGDRFTGLGVPEVAAPRPGHAWVAFASLG